MKQYLHDRQLNKYQKTNIGHLKQDHFSHIQSVGILFNAKEMKHRDVVLAYRDELIRKNIRVRVLGYFNVKMEEDASFPFDFFSTKDINFSYIPKTVAVKRFIAEKFDILINLDTSLQQPVEFVVAASRALFKIGPVTEKVQLYDVMIHTDTSSGLKPLIEEIQQTFSITQ